MGFLVDYHDRDRTLNTNVMQSAGTITSVTTPLGERIAQERERLGLTQGQLAEKAGVGQTTIANYESGLRGRPRSLLQLASALDVSPEWLESGKGAKHAARLGASPLSGGSGVPIEAHRVSLPPADDLPIFNWGDVLNATDLPDRFAVRLPDDAMAPRAPAGTVIRFRKTTEAKQGDGVLVRDGNGDMFFRRMQARTPGHWRALAGNDAYAPLDSIADKLTVVAVLTGMDAAWSDAY